MSRKEGDGNLVMLEDVDRCRRVAPGSERVDCCDWYIAIELLKSSSADHGNVNGPCIVLAVKSLRGKAQELTVERSWEVCHGEELDGVDSKAYEESLEEYIRRSHVGKRKRRLTSILPLRPTAYHLLRRLFACFSPTMEENPARREKITPEV